MPYPSASSATVAHARQCHDPPIGEPAPHDQGEQQVEAQLGPERPVHPVDVVDAHRPLKHGQIDQHIAPGERVDTAGHLGDHGGRGEDGDPVRRIQPDHPRGEEVGKTAPPAAHADHEAADHEEQLHAQPSVGGRAEHHREEPCLRSLPALPECHVVVRDDHQRGNQPQPVQNDDPVAARPAARSPLAYSHSALLTALWAYLRRRPRRATSRERLLLPRTAGSSGPALAPEGAADRPPRGHDPCCRTVGGTPAARPGRWDDRRCPTAPDVSFASTGHRAWAPCPSATDATRPPCACG
ncbi:hypothetical protein SGLAM104S_07953 [Streptomyces glaucescens]